MKRHQQYVGFHQAHPLSDEQVSLLWDAITLRTLITILLSDVKLDMTTDHDAEVIEEREHGMAKLQLIRSVDHQIVVDRLRAVCGFC